MMFEKMSDQELLQETKKLRTEEKKLTSLVLEHLQEVENRKLYCELGISSLFSYCLKELEYSEAEASVRVNAVRLVNCHPEIKKKIDSGALSLTSASMAQSFFREQSLDIRKQKEILQEIEGTSTRETQKILQQKNLTKPRTLILSLSERLIKKLAKVQEDFEDVSELQVIEALLDQYLAKKDQAKERRETKSVPKNQRTITRTVKEAVYSRAHARCEYRSPASGKRCMGRNHLQWDHLRPIALGGSSAEDNIRLLCFSCNQRQRLKLGLARPGERRLKPPEPSPPR
jgi:hypothetical protein